MGIFVLFLAGITVSCQRTPDLGEGLFARLDTNRGMIIIQLEFERTPLTVTNFVALAEGRMDAAEGRPFFNRIPILSVSEGFLIVTGCPEGTGFMEIGYHFPDEIHPELSHDGPGVVAMTHLAPGLNSNLFYITQTALPWLDGANTVFGRVVAGQNVVNSIEMGDRIRRVTIIRNGTAANEFRADQAAFDNLLQEGIARDEERQQARRDEAFAYFQSRFPNAATSPLGVMYYIIEEGTGDRPAERQDVRIFYTVSVFSGESIRAVQRPSPPELIPVGTGATVPGLNETLARMRIGERRIAIIPPELAYGNRWVGGSLIPPNSFLIYDIEMESLGEIREEIEIAR